MVLSAVQNAARARTATTTDARIVNQTKTTKTVNQKSQHKKTKEKTKKEEKTLHLMTPF